MRIRLNDEAAEIHYFMVTDPRFGYNQQPSRWGESGGEIVTFTSSSGRKYRIAAGDYDCSSSTITSWRLVVKGTPYEGTLNAASYTGDMRDVFVSSGLFYAELSPAKRGDLYLNEGVHVAMCQDGGNDGVFGWDCLSEFNRNENHAASWGESGDQDGYESVFRGYYDDNWNTVLHYNGNGDYDVEEKDMPKPKQNAGNAVNNFGLKYQAHVSDVGWCDEVHDGQCAGTVGFGKRLEAIRFTAIPAGWTIYAKAHIQNVGWRDFGAVKAGNVIGTTGKGCAIECLMLDAKSPDNRKLYFQVHQANVGWKGKTPQGYASGTDCMGIRLEAVKVWIG